MKKYIEPQIIIVEINIQHNVMLETSSVGVGGTTNSYDVKSENTDLDIWGEE